MKITFAAIVDGEIIGTRSSGSMPYTDAVVIWSDTGIAGRTNGPGWAVLSWHLSLNGAIKASDAKYIATRYPTRQIVPATPVKVIGMFIADGGPNDHIWAPLAAAADAYAAAEQARKRDAALAETQAEVDAYRAAQARRDADEAAGVAAQNPATVNTAPSARAEAIAARLNAEAVDVGVVEPIVTMTTDGAAQPVDGLARPIVKATRENMAACAAVGLSYWSDHPKPSHVWAVDAAQQAHPVRIDRKRNLAIIAEPNNAIGGNPLVSWSLDADATATLDALAAGDDVAIGGPADTVLSAMRAEVSSMVAVDVADTMREARRQRRQRDAQTAAPAITFKDVAAAMGGRMIVGHVSDPAAPAGALGAPGSRLLTAQPVGPSPMQDHASDAAINAAIDAGEASVAPVTDDAPAALSVTARKAYLGDMVETALGKMIADMTDDDRAALDMTPDQVTAQLKSWLRRSGRALVFKDGRGVTG